MSELSEHSMNTMRWLLGALIVCASTAVPATVQSDPIDDYVRAQVREQRIPGLALGIVRNGVMVRAQGYGYANLEHRVPVHADTVFQSGSIGKMFTAVAVMLMVEDGKLTLDESIRRYLPESPDTWAPITVRQLLNHTSGINSKADLDLRKDYTDDEYLRACYAAKLDFPAGKQWSYSNTAYALLGLLVKRVSGKSYDHVLRERVFAPLNMQTAGLIDERHIVPNRAQGYMTGYGLHDEGILEHPDWVSSTGNSTGDGSLYLTILDFIKWETGVHLGKVLKPASWAEVFRPAPLNSGNSYPYGFGWSLEQFAGRDVRSHGGHWQGFRTFYMRVVEDGIGVIVLTNATSARPEEIARQVIGMYEPKLVAGAAASIGDLEPRVTERLRAILAAPDLTGIERHRYDPVAWPMESSRYRTARMQIGELEELRLFAIRDIGDDRQYRYRARFRNGMLDIAFKLAPDGGIQSLLVQPIPALEAPLTSFGR